MDWKLGVAIFCLIAAFQIKDDSTSLVPNHPSVPQPEARLVELVAPVKGVITDKTDKSNVSCLFVALADIVLKDATVIQNNSQIRDAVMISGKFMFDGEMGRKYPNLLASINEITKKELGDNPNGLDREKAVNLFKALAWAFND